MRKHFAKLLFDEMAVNNDIYLITADLGYGLWDKIRDTYPKRFFNVGSSEMIMMGMAIGLAQSGKIPFVYSITPFALYRPFEMIRNYVNHENIPVHIVGGGRGQDYGHLGFSHWAEDDERIMSCFDEIVKFRPNTETDLDYYFTFIKTHNWPTYINLKK